MAVIVILLWVLSFLFLYFKFKEAYNPIIIIFHYFYGILLLSLFSLTGVPVPTDKTVAYFLIAYTSTLIGVLLAKNKKTNYNKDPFETNYRIIAATAFFLAVAPLTYIFLKNLNSLFSGYEHFVHTTRFERDTISVAGSTFMTSLIDRIVRPVSIFTAAVGISYYLVKKTRIILIFGIYLLIIFSILYVKRIDLMFLLAMFAGGFSALNKSTSFSKDQGYRKYIYSSIIIFITFFISTFRASSYSLHQLILHYGVGYHTFGIALFDHAINNSSSYIHDFVFPGETIFSTFSFILNQLYKALGIEHTPISSYLYSNELGNFIFMGYNTYNGKEISPNAFYTSLYPIYRDMKLFGLIAVPIIYGYFFSRSYLKFKKNNTVYDLTWVVYLTYVGYASLLTPVIMGNTFWIVPLLILMFSKGIKIRS